MNPATVDPLLPSQPELQPRQVHTITDRFAMANTYLLHADKLVVVDPHSEIHMALLQGYLERVLHRSMADIALVLLSHLHIDQTGGLNYLQRHCNPSIAAAANIRQVVHQQRRLLHALPGMARQAGLLPAIFERQLRYVDTWLEDVAGLPANPQWRVIASPAHSPDSLCVYNPFTAELLCADTVIAIERRTPILRSGSDQRKLVEMLHFLRSLRVHYVYPGRGRPLMALDPLTHLSIEW